ncbi:MAG: phosphatase PAP2 family protein [Bacteroidota bacterium]|nr:phosphatase PAP2 family protein [Bacteroidota bacterium]
MRKVLLLLFVLGSFAGFAQNDTLIRKLDSLNKRTDSVGSQVNNTNPKAYNESTGFTIPSFFVLEASNLKQAFTKPFHMTKQNWKDVGKFAIITGALAFADQPIQKFALDLRNHNHGFLNISRQITNFGGPYEGYTLGALGAYGFIFNNKKMQTTTLLALQSYLTGAAVEGVVKFISGRTRPSFYGPNTVARPTFKGPFATSIDYTGAKTNSSFPSGHTTVAFAAATVYALEYKNKPWVPVVAYASASLIGLSRITENKHWATDVLVGAALGYLTGKQVVNNYHRYAKLKAPKQLKNSVSFSMNYEFGHLSPAVVYRF